MAVQRLGLLVRSAPWGGRSGRDQLDLAMAAAALGIEIDLFFLGDGVLHLIEERQPERAGLPPAIQGWRALSELTKVRAWAQAQWLPAGSERLAQLLPATRFIPAAEMPAMQSGCDWLLVL